MSRRSVCNKDPKRGKRITEIATALYFIGHIIIAARSAR
jgi:hypothetical protein